MVIHKVKVRARRLNKCRPIIRDEIPPSFEENPSMPSKCLGFLLFNQTKTKFVEIERQRVPGYPLEKHQSLTYRAYNLKLIKIGLLEPFMMIL